MSNIPPLMNMLTIFGTPSGVTTVRVVPPETLILRPVIEALDKKLLHAEMNNVSGQLRAVAKDGVWKDPGGHEMRISLELAKLLAGLVSHDDTMTLMSLFRYKNGPHGEPQPDGSGLGRAVDIMEYAGLKINLKKPENADGAISGVVAIIGHLPAGKYTLGLPRPKGGSEIDPDNDVFLPVTDHDQVAKSPGRGNIKKDIELLKDASRDKIREAIAGNPEARIQFMYPDGVDHLHVKAVA